MFFQIKAVNHPQKQTPESSRSNSINSLFWKIQINGMEFGMQVRCCMANGVVRKTVLLVTSFKVPPFSIPTSLSYILVSLISSIKFLSQTSFTPYCLFACLSLFGGALKMHLSRTTLVLLPGSPGGVRAYNSGFTPAPLSQCFRRSFA